MGGSNYSQSTTVARTEVSDGKQTIDTASKESRQEKELTFEDILNNLQSQKQLVETLMQNLPAYCKLVETRVSTKPAVAKTERTKLYFYPKKSASHAEEISERLQFLNYYFCEQLRNLKGTAQGHIRPPLIVRYQVGSYRVPNMVQAGLRVLYEHQNHPKPRRSGRVLLRIDQKRPAGCQNVASCRL